MTEPQQETVEAFRRSFSYGSRTDLLFKFLASRNLNDQEAAEFFRGLLERMGDSLDTGDWSEVTRHVYEWQVRGYTPQDPASLPFRYDSAPWTPLRKPIADARAARVQPDDLKRLLDGAQRGQHGLAHALADTDDHDAPATHAGASLLEPASPPRRLCRWRARRMDRATIVNVGLAQPLVGKTEAPAQ